MTPHDQRLNVLSHRGWHCERPNYLCHPVKSDGEPIAAVYLEGILWNEVRVIYLSVSDGLVLLMHDTRDVAFEEFLKWLDLPGDPLDVPVVKERQRGLFGEGE
jgi:hypothetical protein